MFQHDLDGVVLQREGNRSVLAAPQGVYAAPATTGGSRSPPPTTRSGAHSLRCSIYRPRRRSTPPTAGVPRTTSSTRPWAPGAQRVTRRRSSESLAAAGVPAEVVIAARDVAHNPQLRHRGLFEVEDHPVAGRVELPTMPFRFASVERWLRRPAPTVGQHNDEVLGEIAAAAELAALHASGAIGDRVRDA